LRDVRFGNGYRVVEVRNVSSKNAGLATDKVGSLTYLLVKLGIIKFRIRQSCLDEHTLGTGIFMFSLTITVITLILSSVSLVSLI